VSVAGRLKHDSVQPGMPWPQRTLANLRAWCAALVRPPRVGRRFSKLRPSTGRMLIGAVVLIAVIVALMAFVDTDVVNRARRLPVWIVLAFLYITDFGRSGWILIPCGVVLVVLAAAMSPTLPRMAQGVIAALAVRFGYVFLAVALPGLFSSVIKRLIGRARPYVKTQDDPFLFMPFGWRSEFASMPSGHATTAGAAAMAIGLIWPQTRVVMWTYAIAIAVSRVVISAHHPSDVIAGLLVGAIGALIVRDWFATRGLGFAVAPGGSVRARPAPSLRRIKDVARRVIGQ
jgi:membrane-associated phospholipid phosphatase